MHTQTGKVRMESKFFSSCYWPCMADVLVLASLTKYTWKFNQLSIYNTPPKIHILIHIFIQDNANSTSSAFSSWRCCTKCLELVEIIL